MPVGSNPTRYTTTYTYDDLDRLFSKSFVDIRVSTVPSPTPNTPPATGAISTTFYQYDTGHNGVGRLSQVDLPFGVVAYNYDARGLIVKEERSFTLEQIASMSASQVVERTYNALGQLTESDWQGEKWRIKYDKRGLVDKVDWFDPDPTASGWKSVANYERQLIGLPLARNTDFGQTRSFTYDVLARPLTDDVKLDGSTAPLAERVYKYTGAGNLKNVTGHTNNVIADARYTYDLQHRLLTANAPNGYEGDFTYSATGNIMSANVEWDNAAETRHVSYSYGQVDPQAVDKLLNITTGNSYAEFAYDDVGNMTWRSTPDGDTLLHWNGQDQIRRVDTPDGSETYYYDHAGQRMLVVNPDQGVRFWFGEREIHYSLDGTETLNYLHLSAGGPTLARVKNDIEIELQYADALQNLMFSLDKDSEVTASFLYGPFGEVISEIASDAHRRQFNGKENDAVTGLRYYGYRYYDPLILRWNSADPLYSVVPELGQNQPQRMNLYAFSLNNPVRYYDPDGRDAKKDGPGDFDGGDYGGPYCEGGPFSTKFCNEDSEGDDADESDDASEMVFEDSEGMIIEPKPVVTPLVTTSLCLGSSSSCQSEEMLLVVAIEEKIANQRQRLEKLKEKMAIQGKIDRKKNERAQKKALALGVLAGGSSKSLLIGIAAYFGSLVSEEVDENEISSHDYWQVNAYTKFNDYNAETVDKLIMELER